MSDGHDARAHDPGAPNPGAPEPGGPEGLTHTSAEGQARMVDVSAKEVTARTALAEGHILMEADTLRRILDGDLPKGEVLGTARLAGIMAAKRTGELIPLCHVLPGVSVNVEFQADPDLPGVVARATASLSGQTGVELEALVAVSTALLTVYDMAKAVDRGMEISGVRLVSKAGGRSGVWRR